ncbi:MAG: 4-hydroxy-tetrahydrodipicolinate synthase [Solirubrobacteraceae bacterium]|nr:4-hydroxy-tetrahydrodipicolinate synthase [Solirubrobacteraceae bacterium]
MSDLGALLTAIVTPFADTPGLSGRDQAPVDEAAFVRLHKHVIELGSDGVVACGTTGEASTLSDVEHLRVIELAVQEKPAGTTVVAGVGSNVTAHACELTEKATELGVDAVLSVTPYYNRPNRRGIVAHYTEVAKATDKPIILYNIPFRTGTDMPNDLLAELAQIDGIVAVKQSNDANIAPIDGLDLYAGNDDTILRTLEAGGIGAISVASHLVGHDIKRMLDHPEERGEVHARLAPLFAALGVTTNPSPIKAALSMQGHLSDVFRLPIVPCDDHEAQVVRGALAALDLLETGARA